MAPDPKKDPKKKPKKKKGDGKSQNEQSIKGLRHTDFSKEYAKQLDPVDLFRQRFRVRCFTDDGNFDISSYCSSVTWQEQSADTLSYANQSAPLTGSLTMTKPALRQYKKLLPDAFNAMVNPKTKSARFGAIGVVVRLDVAHGSRHGAHFEPLWAMRCLPADDVGADSVEVGQYGTWTLNLVDDLELLSMSMDDWKFTKGKKAHKKGWRCHEIALAVCRRYHVPVRSLAKGTAWMDMNVTGSIGKSPVMMMTDAYNNETAKTGKAYILRWGAPDKKYPMGALEIVPFRRNNALLTLREQITDATLSRSINGNFATWITASATLKQDKGKHKKLTYEAKNDRAIKRFGLIHHTVSYGSVGSMDELKILAKRELAFRLTPIRQAEVVNMGVATVRRGDAVRIKIPEEGYSETLLAVDLEPSSVNQKDSRHGKHNKQSSTALQQAAENDPTLFGVPNVNQLAGVAAKQLEGNLNAATSVPIQVADQGIAFVTSITHSLTPGDYSMDMTMSFTDILDPLDLQAEMDANIRAAKLAAQAAKGVKVTSTGSTFTLGSTTSQTPEALTAAAQYLSSLKIPYAKFDRDVTRDITKEKDHPYDGQHGLDCSASVGWCLHAAGYPLPGSVTSAPPSGSYSGWGAAGQGKQFTIWESGEHIFIEFHLSGQPHMQGNTSGPQGGGAGFRYFAWGSNGEADANGGGFTPRHWSGQ